MVCQNRDKVIGKLREGLEKLENKFFKMRDGLIYRKTKDKKLLFYVPESMKNNVIRTCHDKRGHIGLDYVMKNIQQVY